MAPVEKLVVCAPHEERFYSCDDGPMGPMKLPFRAAHDVRPRSQQIPSWLILHVENYRGANEKALLRTH